MGRLDENVVFGEDNRPWVALVVRDAKPNQLNIPYLESGTRRPGVEELSMILPPWSIERERVGSLLMWF